MRSGLVVAAYVLGSCGLGAWGAACSLVVSTGDLATGERGSDPELDGGTDAPRTITIAPEGGEAGPSAPPAVLLAAGAWHTCAVANGRVSCWGSNTDGQLGDGTRQPRLAPVPVVGLPPGTVTAIGAGYKHTCAIVDGKVWCWGTGEGGPVGPNSEDSDNLVPVEVTGLPSPASEVGGGDLFTCARVDERVYCWGLNDVGRLGDGTTTPHKASTVVVASNGILEDVAQLAVSGDHSCVRKTSGEVWCWGHNDNGTLGNPGVTDSSPRAVRVEGLPGPAQHVSVAAWHACATVGGGVWCWGSGNEGQLGNGALAHSTKPVQVIGHADGVSLVAAAGGPEELDATCASRNGQLSCWGAGQSFRLGDGATGSRSLPAAVTTLPAPVLGLVGGHAYWCAHLANGEVRCWGRGIDGQLGDGAGVDRALPVLVNGL